MFEGFDLSKMNEMLGDLQKKAQQMENENANREFSVKSGAGMVEIKISGKGEVLDVSIEDSLMSDKDSLQILLISAINDAVKLIDNEKKNLAAKMLGDIGNLGGFGGEK